MRNGATPWWMVYCSRARDHLDRAGLSACSATASRSGRSRCASGSRSAQCGKSRAVAWKTVGLAPFSSGLPVGPAVKTIGRTVTEPTLPIRQLHRRLVEVCSPHRNSSPRSEHQGPAGAGALVTASRGLLVQSRCSTTGSPFCTWSCRRRPDRRRRYDPCRMRDHRGAAIRRAAGGGCQHRVRVASRTAPSR